MNTKNNLKKPVLVPVPAEIEYFDGEFAVKDGDTVLLGSRDIYFAAKTALSVCGANVNFTYEVSSAASEPAVTALQDASLGGEEYTLTAAESGIKITYGSVRGAFYAFVTLGQMIVTCNNEVPAVRIYDRPAFGVRGYMLDIGRNKVPKLEEMEKLADMLAMFKINHMELYIEGVPFEYPSFKNMWEGRDILKGEDILELDRYCRERFIELVPTQNNFGHMDKWLEKEYRDLASCPDGFTFCGSFIPAPRCLNPVDPRCEEFVNKLADDLLPYFSSDKYNISCDETLELGQGKMKDACDAKGSGRVYLEFLKKVMAAAARHGKSPLFWDDIIRHYPELLPELPKDAVALEWGYMSNEPPEANCEMLEKLNVRYYTCPGTGAWNTLLGKTCQMKQNIQNAAFFGKKHGAEGMLTTDWGDCGHLQSIATSYSGIMYGAAMSWSPDESAEMDLALALDELVFKDENHVMGQLVLDAGNYCLKEHEMCHNITWSFRMLISGLDNEGASAGVTDEEFMRVKDYLGEIAERLEKTEMRRDDADLIKREYRLAIGVISSMQDVGMYHNAVHAGNIARERELLEKIRSDMEFFIKEQTDCWLVRNRFSYLDDSLGFYEGFKKRAGELLESTADN